MTMYVGFKGESVLAVAPHGRSVALVNREQAVVGSRTGLFTRRVRVREERLLSIYSIVYCLYSHLSI